MRQQSAINPPALKSIRDWHVGRAPDGTQEVVLKLSDPAEARAWAVWLLDREPTNA